MKKLNKVISFFKSNYTKEEVLQLDKKELNQIAKQKGFAIGTILLAIALIAAIGAAIAIASKSGGQDSASQTAKLGASNLVNMGSSIKTVVDKYRINGVDSDNIVFNPNADGSVVADYYGIFNPKEGVQFTPLPKSVGTAYAEPTCTNTANDISTPASGDNHQCAKGATAGSNGYGGFVLTSSFSSLAGTASNDVALIRKGLNADTCVEINKQVNGNSKMNTGNIPSSGIADNASVIGSVTVSSASLLAATNTAQTGPATAQIGGNDQVNRWTEGCLATDNAPNSYFYFNLLKVN